MTRVAERLAGEARRLRLRLSNDRRVEEEERLAVVARTGTFRRGERWGLRISERA
jgi:hypothetical protein